MLRVGSSWDCGCEGASKGWQQAAEPHEASAKREGTANVVGDVGRAGRPLLTSYASLADLLRS